MPLGGLLRERSGKHDLEAELLVAVPTRPTALAAHERLVGLPHGRWRNVMSDRAFEIGPDGLALDRSWPLVIAHRDDAVG